MRKKKKLFTKIAAVLLSAAMAFSPVSGVTPVWAGDTGGTSETNVTSNVRIQFSGRMDVTGIENSEMASHVELKDSNGKLIDDTLADSGEQYHFYKSYIIYGKEDIGKRFTYTISQEQTGDVRYTIDPKVYTINVDVTEENGKIVPIISGDTTTGTDCNFVNSYHATPATDTISGVVYIKATNSHIGNTSVTLKDGIDTFVLKDSNGNIVQRLAVETSAQSRRKFTFDPLTFDKEGTYDYTLSEESTTCPGQTVDPTVYKISYTVTNNETVGKLLTTRSTSSTTYDGDIGTDLVFTNSYSITGTSIVLGGHNYVEGIKNSQQEFTYDLYQLPGNGTSKLIDSVTVIGDSDYRFKPITYNPSDIGSGGTGGVHYEIRQKPVSDSHYSLKSQILKDYGYDPVAVNFKDNGDGTIVITSVSYTGTGLSGTTVYDFTNVYTPDPVELTFGGHNYVENTNDDNTWYDITISNGEDPSKVGTDAVNRTLTVQGDADYGSTSVTYRKEGTYKFTVSLKKESQIGTNYKNIIADTKVYNFTVDVKSDDNGTLMAYITGNHTTGDKLDLRHLDFHNQAIQQQDISGTITWDDDNNRDGLRPHNVYLTLYANDKEVETKEISTDKSYDFREQPETDENGNKITYKVVEKAIDGYDITYDGFDITNTHSPTTIDIKGNIKWDDKDNKDGLRPESVTLQLTADGERVGGPVTVTAKDNWAYEWPDVQMNKAGKKRTFKVTQSNVEKYQTTSSTDNAGDVFTFTNIYAAPAPTEPPKPTETPKPEPEKISVSGKITWDDNNNADGKRPDKVTLTLTADGKEVKTIETDNDSYEFGDMPLKKDGKEIEYKIVEKAIDGYEITYDGFNITNKHTPDTKHISGKITWDDDNNRDGKRPKEAKITLIKDGKEVKTITVPSDGTFDFGDVPMNEDGKEIKYEIKEKDIDGYDITYTDNDIVNQHEAEKADIKVSVSWDDKDDEDKIRPDKVVIQMMDGDKKIGDPVTITAKDGWTYTFKDMYVNENGKAISYSVSEDAVDHYTTVVNKKDDGFDVINTHKVIEKSDISGTITWIDNNNKDKTRPDDVVIILTRDGKEIGRKTVSSSDDWKYDFGKQPKTDENGKAYTYELKEEDVKGYDISVKGYDVTNTLKKTDDNKVTEKVNPSGTITWNDNDNKGKTRPDKVTIILYANGNEINRKEVTAKDNWKYDFGQLDKLDKNGKEISYTIKEADVNGYDIAIKGFDVTNTLKKSDDANKSDDKNDNTTDGKSTGDSFPFAAAAAAGMIAGVLIGTYRKRKKETCRENNKK